MIATPRGIFVLTLGASTPVGRDAWSSAAAVRAGVSGLTEHPYIVDSAGEPMRVAMAPWLEPGLPWVERLNLLLAPAVDQVLAPLAQSLAGIRVGLVVGLPAVRPGRSDDLESQVRDAMQDRFGEFISALGLLPAGHAAGLLGLYAACVRLQNEALDACVVAGAESYIQPDTLEWLEGQDQLHGAGPLNNAWGFIPGEGAGAVLIARDDVVARTGAEPLARIISAGRGLEPNRIKTHTVCTGEGLTAAFREALEGLAGDARVTDVYCDMNGEPYRADEFGFAVLRTKESFVSASDFVAPADCWGDVSAASGPLSIALASVAGAKSYARGPLAFVWASSEGGERGAVLLESQRMKGV